MEKELTVGSETKLKVEVKNDKLVLGVVYDGGGVDGMLSISVDANYFLDKLAAAIPGQLDDSVINAIKVGMKLL